MVNVLGQDTLLSQCLSPPRCTNGRVLANLMLGVTLGGLASHLGGSRNTPTHFMLRKPG